MSTSDAMRIRNIAAVVVGGSAGALEVVRMIVKALPASFAAPVIIVMHLPPRAPNGLPELLKVDCAATVKQAEDKEPLQGSTVYVAPPGYHLLVESQRTLALSIDAPVHYSRPAIDVLFESACDVYADGLVGILLSGASLDGAAGMRAIHQAGGVTIVQDPASAEAGVMPASALALFNPTHTLQATRIAPMLLHLLTRAGPAGRNES